MCCSNAFFGFAGLTAGSDSFWSSGGAPVLEIDKFSWTFCNYSGAFLRILTQGFHEREVYDRLSSTILFQRTIAGLDKLGELGSALLVDLGQDFVQPLRGKHASIMNSQPP